MNPHKLSNHSTAPQARPATWGQRVRAALPLPGALTYLLAAGTLVVVYLLTDVVDQVAGWSL